MSSIDVSVPDGYELIEKLGSGGMGDVYKARHITLDRVVALKITRFPESAEEVAILQKRFLQEARIIARLNHPNIVNVYNCFIHGQSIIIEMEYLEGGTLGELFHDSRSHNIPEAFAQDFIENRTLGELNMLRVGQEVCGALEYAHSLGIVHRDVKPSNIFLTSTGGIKLFDFGIARDTSLTQQITKAGILTGSPAYMSPEQIKNQPLDGRTDIYSLGCVFFHCLTGRVPFHETSEILVCISHLQQPAPDPGLLNPNLSPELRGMVLRCLAKTPEERFESAAELDRELKLLAGEIATASESPASKLASELTKTEAAPPESQNLRVIEQTSPKEKEGRLGRLLLVTTLIVVVLVASLLLAVQDERIASKLPEAIEEQLVAMKIISLTKEKSLNSENDRPNNRSNYDNDGFTPGGLAIPTATPTGTPTLTLPVQPTALPTKSLSAMDSGEREHEDKWKDLEAWVQQPSNHAWTMEQEFSFTNLVPVDETQSFLARFRNFADREVEMSFFIGEGEIRRLSLGLAGDWRIGQEIIDLGGSSYGTAFGKLPIVLPRDSAAEIELKPAKKSSSGGAVFGSSIDISDIRIGLYSDQAATTPTIEVKRGSQSLRNFVIAPSARASTSPVDNPEGTNELKMKAKAYFAENMRNTSSPPGIYHASADDASAALCEFLAEALRAEQTGTLVSISLLGKAKINLSPYTSKIRLSVLVDERQRNIRVHAFIAAGQQIGHCKQGVGDVRRFDRFIGGVYATSEPMEVNFHLGEENAYVAFDLVPLNNKEGHWTYVEHDANEVKIKQLLVFATYEDGESATDIKKAPGRIV